MCTIVVKAFRNVPAVSVLQASIMHDVNGITINTCPQIITSASCMQNICNSYASVMPKLQRQRLNTHHYSENDNVQTMRKMDDIHLVDFVELKLKAKEDFNAAYAIDVVLVWVIMEKTSLFFSLVIGHVNFSVVK